MRIIKSDVSTWRNNDGNTLTWKDMGGGDAVMKDKTLKDIGAKMKDKM
jgi:hypothetical protein